MNNVFATTIETTIGDGLVVRPVEDSKIEGIIRGLIFSKNNKEVAVRVRVTGPTGRQFESVLTTMNDFINLFNSKCELLGLEQIK